MRTFLSPRSVAVIGASRDPSSIGGHLFQNLLMSGFHGPVYPVNPRAAVVHGVVAYPTVTAVPGEVDVAFVVVPATHVADVARECGAKGVRGLVVISAGFAEVGGTGSARQDDLVQICRAYGMRIIGPNCMGIVNTSDEIRLNGTFATIYPPRGRVGFLSQSGALGLAVMRYATEVGVGLSSSVIPYVSDQLARRRAAGSACRPSCPWGTRPTSPVTTSSPTGMRIPIPMSRSCISSPSGTRADSHA